MSKHAHTYRDTHACMYARITHMYEHMHMHTHAQLCLHILLCCVCITTQLLLGVTMVFNVDPNTLDKGERLEYGESMMIHAMVLTAVNEKQVGYQFVKRMQPYLY